MPKITPVDSAGVSQGSRRSGVLAMVGLFGAALVGTAIYLAVERPSVDSIWSAVCLEIGAGVLLFAVLLWLEESVVKRATTAIIERFTGSQEQIDRLAETMSESEKDRFLRDDGPWQVAQRWIDAACRGDYGEMWDLSDDNWRLCRVQAWLWNNADTIPLRDEDRDQKAAALLAGQPADLWAEFVNSETSQYGEVFGGLDADRLGTSFRRRKVGAGYEIVVFIPLDDAPEGFIIQRAALVDDTHSVLIHHVGDRCWVAGQGEAPPTPGWPPSWWAIDDPALDGLDF